MRAAGIPSDPPTGAPPMPGDEFEGDERPTLLQDEPSLAGAQAPASRRGETLAVLVGVIDKAIAMRRFDEAAPVVGAHLERVAEDCEANRWVAPETIDVASRYALRLAAATGDGSWVNLIVRIHRGRGVTLSVAVVDALYDVLRHARDVNWPALVEYVEFLQSRSSGMGPAERFASRRIAGLLRLAPG
jgi:hypothetical protein